MRLVNITEQLPQYADLKTTDRPFSVPSLLQVAIDYMDHDCSFAGQAQTLECVKAVLVCAEHESVNTLKVGTGESMLAYASRRGQALTARYLVSHGADPCLRDGYGITALHWLPFLQDEEMAIVASLLVDRGADINARTTRALMLPEHLIYIDDGAIPLHFAVVMRSLRAVQVLRGRGADPSVKINCLSGWRMFSVTSST
jgi:hypothetical protein